MSRRSRYPISSPEVTSAQLRLADLDTRLLMAFRAVAENGTFGRAATELGYTQSAVSQQISSLEKVLGVAVFDRPGGPRPVELTPFGRILLERSAELLRVLDAIADDVRAYRYGDVGRIDVGTIQSTSTALVPSILRRMLADRPDLDVRLQERYEESDLIQMLLRGDLDVTFLVSSDPPGVTSMTVLQDPFVVLARADDVGLGPVSVTELTGQPLIGQAGNEHQDALVTQNLRDAGASPSYVFRSADNGTVASMVRVGLGWALMPRLAVAEYVDDPELAIRPLDPAIPAREIRLAWRGQRTLSPAAKQFCEIAAQVAEAMSKRHPALAISEED